MPVCINVYASMHSSVGIYMHDLRLRLAIAIISIDVSISKCTTNTPIYLYLYVYRRLLVPSMAQGIALLGRGDASRDDIDTGMKLGAGHPMGPLMLSDYVGLDLCLSIMEGWVEKFPNEPAFFVPDLLREMVAQGKFGRKSGEGFYKWDGNKPVA